MVFLRILFSMFWIDFGVLSLVERSDLLSEYLQYWSQDGWTGKYPILDSKCSLYLPLAPSIFLHPTPEPIQWKSLALGTEECLQCVVTVVRYLDRNKWLIFVISSFFQVGILDVDRTKYSKDDECSSREEIYNSVLLGKSKHKGSTRLKPFHRSQSLNYGLL